MNRMPLQANTLAKSLKIDIIAFMCKNLHFANWIRLALLEERK